LCFFILLFLPAGAAAQGPLARISTVSACERARSEDVITSVSVHGELDLASGRTLKLLDVRLPAADDDNVRRPLAWLQSLVGRRVAASTLAAGDRWGRQAADVALLDEPSPIDIADLLVAEGLAMVDAGDKSVLCRPELLIAERRARARRLGVWARKPHGPFAAHDVARLKALTGRFALVEGVVRSVGERRQRTYLNFGRDWKDDMTVTIPKRTWTTLVERGLSAAALKGKRVRVRGVLEEWQGVAMEITAADMLEVLGQDSTRP
jgi:hypothetical protein